jgi:anti-sigma B factor antagonist
MDVATDVTDDGVAVVRTEGRLNMAAAPQLRTTVAELTAAGRSRIVVDLSALTFVDSSGLGALIGGLKAARQAGGDLRIAAPAEQVRTVLGLTNLDRVLRPYATVEAALDDW